MQSNLDFRSVTPDRWADFEALFCPRGACGSCRSETRPIMRRFIGEH